MHRALAEVTIHRRMGLLRVTRLLQYPNPPSIVSLPSDVEDIELGDAGITLNCTAIGNPAPVYRWNSTLLQEKTDQPTIASASLRPGSYTCSASNKLGRVWKHFSVKPKPRDVHPLELHPPKVVVRYGDPVSVNCSTSTKHIGLGWEATVGAVDLRDDVNVITWTVPALTDWVVEPICYVNTDDEQQTKTLSVIVYKTPDSVSISYVNHTGPVMEKTQYELQCDIKNIVPVQNLTVRWYKGQTLVDSQTFTNNSKTPVSVPAPLLITPSRADDGAQYWCEAELDLGAEGPQPPPVEMSETLNITHTVYI
ncbi:vascular cell adhesion protein 1-like [Chanos chanos]|uniref:Vascular cell adhesion protein 1-like n=1 Tax=Chanos chanos TaxID=29144 RepID=A0A6J2WRC4_CHACN|nr:vascular cell adhesion protein 1-like [Chanos chanos]